MNHQCVLLWGCSGCRISEKQWATKHCSALFSYALFVPWHSNFDHFLISSSFECIQYNDNISEFWKSFSRAATAAAAANSHFGLPQDSPTQVSSQDAFVGLFQANAWHQNVVLLINELSKLHIFEMNVSRLSVKSETTMKCIWSIALISLQQEPLASWTSTPQIPESHHSMLLIVSRTHISLLKRLRHSFMSLHKITVLW